MAGSDVGAPRQARHGKKLHKGRRRLNVRIDMTPMVDVVMLLITFFMLTTVFNRPQTMEINMPGDETPVEVAESNLLTLRVAKGDQLYWNFGVEPPQVIEFPKLRPMLVQSLAANPKLICLVKVDRASTYKSMVDVMDELNLASITRFSLAPFRDFDRQLIEGTASP
ncbi:MAG TPA: biopolymer transporter ExbD [Candidatus Krumholzibacteria bacterium]|nr:biopolymer transporter ExbD [Candidatus Krumholzibacteria bacterium]